MYAISTRAAPTATVWDLRRVERLLEDVRAPAHAARSFMLTEDIDCRCALSAQAARSSPTRGSGRPSSLPAAGALWGQRLRWAQGWSQVSLAICGTLRNPAHVRQKLGPCICWAGARSTRGSRSDVPDRRVLAASGSPPSAGRADLRGDDAVHVQRGLRGGVVGVAAGCPELRKRGAWFVFYGLSSQLFYVELKNVIHATSAHERGHAREALEGHAADVAARSPVHASSNARRLLGEVPSRAGRTASARSR